MKDLKKMTERQLMNEKNRRTRKLLQLLLDVEVERRVIRRINNTQVQILFGRELRCVKRDK